MLSISNAHILIKLLQKFVYFVKILLVLIFKNTELMLPHFDSFLILERLDFIYLISSTLVYFHGNILFISFKNTTELISVNFVYNPCDWYNLIQRNLLKKMIQQKEKTSEGYISK
jgi:hypothetical protein